jgi:hypothetical protein
LGNNWKKRLDLGLNFTSDKWTLFVNVKSVKLQQQSDEIFTRGYNERGEYS